MSKPNKKIYPQAVLKNLPEARQQALIEFLETPSVAVLVNRTDKAGEVTEHSRLRPPSLKEACDWLSKDGISVSTGVLSSWRSWYLLKEDMALNEQTADELVADLKEGGIVKNAEEALLAGQLFFSQLAVRERDNKGFVRVLNARSRAKTVSVLERRIKLLEEREAKTKEVINDSVLSPEQKNAKMREILGM